MSSEKQVRLVWWDFLPIALVLFCFVALAIANWNYESTFFEPVIEHNDLNYYLGPDLLAFGCILGLFSSLFLLMARESRADRASASWGKVILLGFLALIFFIVSMSIIAIGPEALIESQDQFPQGVSPQ